MMEKLISIIIPMYNEEGNVRFVYSETKKVCEEIKGERGYEYEIIFVNDGSSDNTLNLLKEIKAKDPQVRVLNMDKNRGEAAALSAGFAFAKGQYIFTMDGDGQNDPRYFKELLEKLEEGYKVATGYRVKRKEPFFTRRVPSFIANHIIAFVTGLKVRDNGCSL
ncbi:MAG: glycosyltransferase family 2 protein, partial [Caldimicrobium sp.]